MRRDQSERVEAAVRAANPVPYAFDLVDTAEADEVTLLVAQRRRTMITTPARTPPLRKRPPLRRRTTIWAFAAGVIVTLALGGAVLLHLRDDGTPASDQPATVTTPVEAPSSIGVESLSIRGYPAGVAGIAWSPDGTHLATANKAIEGTDDMAKVYDATTGDELLSFPLGNFDTDAVALAYSPDGTHIAVGGEARAIYDAATGEEVLGDFGDWFLAFSPDGTHIAVGGAWGAAGILDADTGDYDVVLPLSPSWVWAAAFSPDGTRIATTWGTAVKVWDAVSGDELVTLESFALYKVRDVAWSPDGTRIASTWGTAVKVWDAVSGDELVTLTGHTNDEPLTLLNLTKGVQAVAWSPDGTRIATAGDDGTARIWDAASGDELATVTGHDGPVTDVAWSPDGTQIATAGLDGTARVWNVG